MNVAEKAKQQGVINNLISGEDAAIKKAVTQKDGFRAKIQDLQTNGTRDFSAQYVDKKLQEIQVEVLTAMQTAYTDTETRLNQLLGLLQERDAVLDLTNPALSVALSIIPTLGAIDSTNPGRQFDEAVKINANFVHDQPALRALRTAYLANGIQVTGNIDEMIYDAEKVIENLKELAYQGFVQDGSINTFAVAFSKFAALEGMTTEKMPDPIGADEAMRRAAGL